ncbi:MAG: DUF3299 domain-containing protein [Planctomycetota bacterium]
MSQRPLLLLLLPLGLAACSEGDEEFMDVTARAIHGAPLGAPMGTSMDSGMPGNPVTPQPATGGPLLAGPERLEPPLGVPPAGGHSSPGSGHASEAAAPADLPEGVTFLTFEKISWPEYEPPELREIEDETLLLSDFPEHLQQLDGERAALDGYMVPVDFEERKVTSFILSRYLPGCCFGVMPLMDEWVEIEVLVEGGVDYFPFQTVRVMGEFEVGEVLDDYGYVRSIYRMKSNSVEEQF